jgi:hypothetical protein
MYARAIPLLIGTPLLGSWWGLLFAPVLIIVLAVRAVLEERTLKAELDGYADYAKRVRAIALCPTSGRDLRHRASASPANNSGRHAERVFRPTGVASTRKID